MRSRRSDKIGDQSDKHRDVERYQGAFEGDEDELVEAQASLECHSLYRVEGGVEGPGMGHVVVF